MIAFNPMPSIDIRVETGIEFVKEMWGQIVGDLRSVFWIGMLPRESHAISDGELIGRAIFHAYRFGYSVTKIPPVTDELVWFGFEIVNFNANKIELAKHFSAKFLLNYKELFPAPEDAG